MDVRSRGQKIVVLSSKKKKSSEFFWSICHLFVARHTKKGEKLAKKFVELRMSAKRGDGGLSKSGTGGRERKMANFFRTSFMHGPLDFYRGVNSQANC